MTEPILRWAGGKRQIAQKIRSSFPRAEYDTYHEPFFGSGAVFFETSPDKSTINDSNSALINFYNQLRDKPGKLIEECERHQGLDPAEYYYEARKRFNELRRRNSTDSHLEEAALFLYLNRTCFNGLYRENENGEFNIPYGDPPDATDIVPENQIQKASEALQCATILNQDFSYIKEKASPGDLVYFDPPFTPNPNSGNSAGYTSKGFEFDDQRRLRDLAIGLAEGGVDVIVSVSAATAQIYEDAKISVNSKIALSDSILNRSVNSENREYIGEVYIVVLGREAV